MVARMLSTSSSLNAGGTFIAFLRHVSGESPEPDRVMSQYVAIQIERQRVAFFPGGAGFGSIGKDSLRRGDVGTNASVGTSTRLERLNSLVRSCASRSETFRLTVASDVLCAAGDRPPASATASTIDIASKRSMSVSVFWKDTSRFCQIPNN